MPLLLFFGLPDRWVFNWFIMLKWPRVDVLILSLIAACCVFLLAFVYIADEVSENSTRSFDSAVSIFVRGSGPSVRPEWFREGVRDVTALGSYPVLTIVLIAAVGASFLLRARAAAWYMLLAVIGGVILSNALKLAFARPRPEIVSSAKVFSESFPSGHAALSAITYLSVAAILALTTESRALQFFYVALGAFLTFAVGLSRIELGVHYPTDVLAGWSIGSAWALACWIVVALAQRYSSSRKSV